MKCIKCGADLQADAKFCVNCGASQQPTVKFCPQCGAKTPLDSRFCSSCGFQYKEEILDTNQVENDDLDKLYLGKISDEEIDFEEYKKLTLIERVCLEQAYEFFYDKYNFQKAYELIAPLYKKHKESKVVCDVYLPILAVINKDDAIAIIETLDKQTFKSTCALIDIYIQEDLLKAEKLLDEAETKYPDNYFIKYRKAYWLYKTYEDTNKEIFLEEYKSILSSLHPSSDKMENSWYIKIKRLSEQSEVIYNKTYCSKNNIYYGLLYEDLMNEANKLVVSSFGETAFSSIQDAINFAKEGAKIVVKSGTYNEKLEINKQITLVGEEGNLPEVSIESGTVCVITKDATIKNICFKNTNTEDKQQAYCENGLIEVSSNAEFENCVFDGSFDTNLKICGNAISPKIRNCEFSNARVTEIQIEKDSTPLITKCNIHDNSVGCIVIKDNANPTIKETIIHDIKGAGIAFLENASSSIRHCEIYGGSGKSPALFIVDNAIPTLKDCNIHDFANCAVQIGKTSMPSFTDCEIHNNIECQVSVTNNANPLFENCRMYKGKTGLVTRKNSSGTFNKCTILFIEGVGIKNTDSSSPTFKNCEISSCDQEGVIISKISKPSYEKCNFTRNHNCQIKLEEQSDPTLSYCKLHDAKAGGLYITGTANGVFNNCDFYNFYDTTMKGEIACVKCENGCQYTTVPMPCFTKCKMHDSEGYGILLQGGEGIYDSCEVYNNYKEGFCNKVGENPINMKNLVDRNNNLKNDYKW